LLLDQRVLTIPAIPFSHYTDQAQLSTEFHGMGGGSSPRPRSRDLRISPRQGSPSHRERRRVRHRGGFEQRVANHLDMALGFEDDVVGEL
jgi:hypothetical protein